MLHASSCYDNLISSHRRLMQCIALDGIWATCQLPPLCMTWWHHFLRGKFNFLPLNQWSCFICLTSNLRATFRSFLCRSRNRYERATSGRELTWRRSRVPFPEVQNTSLCHTLPWESEKPGQTCWGLSPLRTASGSGLATCCRCPKLPEGKIFQRKFVITPLSHTELKLSVIVSKHPARITLTTLTNEAGQTGSRIVGSRWMWHWCKSIVKHTG